jgi:hypothetical protein
MSEHRGALTAEGELYPSPRRALDYLDVARQSRAMPSSSAGLRWARIPLPMELNHINVWLLRHADGWMLVDTGLADDVCRAAWHTLEAGHLEGLKLRRIFITHDHPDHMGLSRWLHERHGAPVWMSAVGHAPPRYLATPRTSPARLQHAFYTAHGMHVALETLKEARWPRTRLWFGGLPPLARPATGGDRAPCGGRGMGADRDQRPLPGTSLPARRAAPGIDLRRPGAADDLAERERAALTARGESAARLPRVARAARALCAGHAGAAVARAPFRGLHRRIDVLRSHHHEQLANLRAGLPPGAVGRLRPAAGHVRASPCGDFTASWRWARPWRICITFGMRANSA